jgi:iron uptake system EfeUOB component EfeO/EfeM
MIDKIAFGLLLAGLLLSAGCSSDSYPTEMTLEDAPETIAEAFKDEKNPKIKAMATQATQLLKARNYTGAHGILKQLMSLPDLTPEQRDLLAGGMMAVAENLQKAAEQGNAQAGQYLKMQSFGK